MRVHLHRALLALSSSWPELGLATVAWAQRENRLPVWIEWSGFYAIDENLNMVFVDRDSFEEVPVLSGRFRDLAFIIGSERFPFLQPYVPARGKEDDCSWCSGTGIEPFGAQHDLPIRCICGGLGWVPAYWDRPDRIS